MDEFVSAYTERFPAEEKGLRQLVQLCLDIRQEAQRAPDFLLISDLVRLRKLYPTLVHVRLFGSAYLAPIEQTLKRVGL